ncbi:nucleoporin NUP42 [Takifugu rubripes]|uniref:Nucleoporin NUP42 n=1 Tax=Takifugu rubripes TaxID=31033 RepID=A0A3B5K884_TAKRU|nr:nucleoporin-like protein 2 [Takifugu rubripes]|eukprot:XP_003969103.1 PREDICTED: nucleoporin-like protein 2 [Takifugu rubripes]
MTVCSFFLQGRCRYGEKCWNEHPRGGSVSGGGGGFKNNSYNRSAPQQQPRQGTGGFGNRVWVNPSQQKGAFIQPSSFSHGGTDWAKGDGGRKGDVRASDFSFSSQNRFSSLASPSTFDRGGRGNRQPVVGGDEDDVKILENIQSDIEAWASSGQWAFSCYSNLRVLISGFTDHSPEEIRLEYYSSRASGDLQSYVNGTNQLLNQWRNRVQELKIMSPSTRAALLAELNNPSPQASTGGFGSTPAAGFGSSASSFESKGFGSAAPVQASTFSFAAGSSGFGPSLGFGQNPVVPTQPPSGFGSSSGFGSGFGSSSGGPSAASSSSFSFKAPTSDKPTSTPAFGSASGFSFSAGAGGGAFGSKESAPAGSSGLFGKTTAGFGTSAPSSAAGSSANGTSGSLFSLESSLTPEELNQFKSKTFSLGQIPLKPPPSNMLVV